MPTAMSRSSSNHRGAPACSRNHAAISASQPLSTGPSWTASSEKPWGHSANGFQSGGRVGRPGGQRGDRN
eukprot:15444302-Alexandrium_andersonii.AAC.1